MAIKGPITAKTNLKKNLGGGLNLPDFMTYYKATQIKTMWDSLKNKHTQ